MTSSEQSENGGRPASHGAHILVVDDERAMRHTLAELLGRMGYQATAAASGPEALEQIGRQRFDVVILDLKMPGMNGTEVLQAARPLAPDTVFIILTAYGTLDSAIAAIRHGAFDYLLKPSPVEEIVRAVEAGLVEQERRQRCEDPVVLLERALANLKSSARQAEPPPSAERFLQVADITVDTFKRLVVVCGQPVDLTPTEFGVLTYLIRHWDRIVSCRELVAHVRGWDLDERDARLVVRPHIHRLRKKLKHDPQRPPLIRTIRGSGYIITPETGSPPAS